MSDLITRKDAISRISDLLMCELKGERLPTWNEVYRAINDIPSVEYERTAKVVVHEGFVHICDIALPVTEHLCDACKKKVIIGDDYCSHCGAKLEWE